MGEERREARGERREARGEKRERREERGGRREERALFVVRRGGPRQRRPAQGNGPGVFAGLGERPRRIRGAGARAPAFPGAMSSGAGDSSSCRSASAGSSSRSGLGSGRSRAGAPSLAMGEGGSDDDRGSDDSMGFSSLAMGEGGSDDDCGSDDSIGLSASEAAGPARPRRALGEVTALGHGATQGGASLRGQLLPPFGRWAAGELRALPPPRLHPAPRLAVVLRARGGVAASRRSAAPVAVGRVLVAARYGTPRRFPCSQITSRVLTVRNQGELPTMLHFDDAHQAALGEKESRARVVASPEVVEWLMGVPPGWTDERPLPGPAGVFAAGHGGPLASLSLFSGCGALDLGLARWCWPVACCEACPAAARVLRARMADGALPEAPLHPDVRRLHAADLRGVVDVVMGFPCQDISGAGGRAGLVGARSALVFEGCASPTKRAAASCCWRT